MDLTTVNPLGLFKPRPVSVWLTPIEFGVIAVLVGSAAILFYLVGINKRLRRVERIVTSL